MYVFYEFFVMIRFFKEASVDEREHAEKFMEYQVMFSVSTRLFTLFQLWSNSLYLICSNGVQNKRGGKVKLQSMMMPISDYDHLEKGDALYGRLRPYF